MTRIRLETRIHAPIERVFDLARDIDLHARSMTATGEDAVAGRTSGRIGLGETVTWRARHFGRWWTLTSRITTLDSPTTFADEQVAGPFLRFEHVHRFDPTPDGTLMVDLWHHTAPFGLLGWVADQVLLTRHMRGLLQTRNAALKAEAERPTDGQVSGNDTHSPTAVAVATNSGRP